MTSFMSYFHAPFWRKELVTALVAHPPIARVFLRLERVHVCVDVLVLHCTFSRSKSR